jgi:hypothetical protein
LRRVTGLPIGVENRAVEFIAVIDPQGSNRLAAAIGEENLLVIYWP